MDHELDRLIAQVEQLRVQVDHAAAARATLTVPSLAEFVVGKSYLAQAKIFPRQLTMLRVVFCDVDGLTDYDRQVLAQWGRGFTPGTLEPGATVLHWEPAPDRDYVMGTTPDLVGRMTVMRGRGRRWFREPNLVMGRRAGKGHLGSLVCARLVWELLALGDPQQYFGIPRNKKITIPVFAGNHEQACDNLFGDIAATIIEAPCFAPFVARMHRDRLVLATPADLGRADRMFEGTIEIVAKHSTGSSGRGPATVAQYFDEMTYIDPATSQASAEQLYASATPALDQFGPWAMVMELSSPYQMTGEFYAIHRRALEIDPATGTAAYPETCTLQLPSWEPYVDHDTAGTIPMLNPTQAAKAPCMRTSGGSPRCFPPTGWPITTDDEQMAQFREAKPREFRQERLAQWGTVANPYLEPAHVEAMFAPYKDTVLHPNDRGALNGNYLAVIDPAVTHDAFAWAIGHADPADDTGRPTSSSTSSAAGYPPTTAVNSTSNRSSTSSRPTSAPSGPATSSPTSTAASSSCRTSTADSSATHTAATNLSESSHAPATATKPQPPSSERPSPSTRSIPTPTTSCAANCSSCKRPPAK